MLFRSPMDRNTTASLDKLTFTNNVDFGKCEDSSGFFSPSKDDSNSLDVKLKVFKKGDKKNFRLVHIFTMGEANFNQFMQLWNQLVKAAENFSIEEDLSLVLKPTLSKDMDE